MKQYISKDALVAEIERRKQTWQHQDQQYVNGGKDVCDYLLGFLDTLEVKEIDFEKEFDNYAKDITACDVQFEPFTHLYECAKYFFELGLKTQKGK